MEYKLAYIEERDVDFAIMREMQKSKAVQELFFDKVNMSGQLVKTFHSLVQEEEPGKYGESDIVFIFQKDDGKKFAIFVEDKINADAQPQQRDRYDVRANLLKIEEGFDNYFIILCAPDNYKINEKYDLRISHNDIEQLCVDDLDREVFKQSCNTKMRNNTIENKGITAFWNSLIDLVNKEYDYLKFSRVKRARGSSAFWPEFGTNVSGLIVCYKSDQNTIDFQFSKMARRRNEVIEVFKELNVDISDYHFEDSTSGGLLLKYYLPNDKKVAFTKSFESQENNVKFIMDKVVEMTNIALKIGDSGYSVFPL
ncbi:MAG: hypothetical protein K5923_03160 [Clostridia bacterium]|nr:hypothetical protein [Clostridia bacterium]